jgi:monoterpene epsilon-lactone hydrolase
VRDQAQDLVRSYLDGHDAADPMTLPLYGDLAGLPPIRVHVGNDEGLLDDSLRYVERTLCRGAPTTSS